MSVVSLSICRERSFGGLRERIAWLYVPVTSSRSPRFASEEISIFTSGHEEERYFIIAALW